MERFDRRELLKRAGEATLVAGVLAGPGWIWATRTDPRLRELARAIHGDVVSRTAPGYDAGRVLYNTRFDGVRPLALVYPESVADVQRVVRWARKHGIRLAARSGGHSYGGYSTTTGVVVDLGRLATVRVSGATAKVGAGAQLIDVDAALWQHGLALPAGTCPTVGIAGLTLGGGVGFLSRKYGLTCDNLRSATVVTAAGASLVAAVHRHADLFWALRGGGGGNFGIATDFTFAVQPVSQVSIARIVWPWSSAAQAIEAWQAWAPTAPDELFSVLDLAVRDQRGPGATPTVTSGAQYLGSTADLNAALAPLVAAAPPKSLKVTTKSYMDAVFEWAGCAGPAAVCHLQGNSPAGVLPRGTWKAKSDYANRRLSSAGIAALVTALEARVADPQPGHLKALLDSYGGAIGRVPKTATAFVHRDALFSVQEIAECTTAADAGANVAWLNLLNVALRPHVSGFAYQNYIDPELANWTHAYYGANYPRLQKVKRTYDPHEFFRFAQSIRP